MMCCDHATAEVVSVGVDTWTLVKTGTLAYVGLVSELAMVALLAVL